MSGPFLLYHWSPTTNRSGILRRGLEPGRESVDGLWRPPYVCYADTPLWAWELSGAMQRHVPEWDLWCVRSDVPSGYEVLGGPGESIYEFRVYERVWKRDVLYVATRSTA